MTMSIFTKDFKGYDDKIAVSQITISKPSFLNRLKKMNSTKPIEKRITPFSFIPDWVRNKSGDPVLAF